MSDELAVHEIDPETLPDGPGRHIRLSGGVPEVTVEVLMKDAEGHPMTRCYDTGSVWGAIWKARRENPGAEVETARRLVRLEEDLELSSADA